MCFDRESAGFPWLRLPAQIDNPRGFGREYLCPTLGMGVRFMNSDSRSLQENQKTLVRAALHDMNNRLSVVYGAACLLIDNLCENKRLSKKTRARLDTLDRALESLARYRIASIQVLLRPYAAREFSLKKVLQQVIDSFQPKVNIKLSIDGGVQNDIVLCTCEEAFKEAATIVLDNGVRASSQSGIVMVSATRSIDRLLVSVKDNGDGFDRVILDKLGFQQVESRWGGSGTGLWICMQLVTQVLQGTLQLRNIKGDGAEVAIVIPLQAELKEAALQVPGRTDSSQDREAFVDFKPLTPEAQRYFQRKFLPRIRSLRQKIRKEALAICIWGPGTPEYPLFQVRVDLLNELRQLGHVAFFSEELTKQSGLPISSQGMPSLRTEEFLHASAADLIILIRCSPGSIAEFHDFAQFRSIAQNMVVVTDESDTFGYSDKGALLEHERLYGKVIRYGNSADIVSQVLDIVGVLQCQKFLARQYGKDWRL